MAVRGVKPKPIELRVFKNAAKAKEIDRESVERFAALAELQDPPEWLTEAQKSEWRYVIENAAPGQLRRIDHAVLSTYCVALDAHKNASMKVNEKGLLVASPVKGEPMQNPYLAILNKQALIVLKAAAEMGLTPSSRTRVATGNATKKKDDDWDF